MKNWNTYIREKTHSRSFIWKVSIGILVLGVALGFVVGLLSEEDQNGLEETYGMSVENRLSIWNDEGSSNQMRIESFLGDPDLSDEVLIMSLHALSTFYLEKDRDWIDGLLRDRVGERSAEAIANYLLLLRGDVGNAQALIESLAAERPPVRFANRLLGDVASENYQLEEAYQFYRIEGLFPDASESREFAISILLDQGDFERLDILLEEDLYQDLNTVSMKIDRAIQDHDWWLVAKMLPIEMYSDIDLSSLALALICAGVWGIVLFRLGPDEKLLSPFGGVCLLAIFAGAASTVPTVFLVMIESEYVGYQPDGDVLKTVAFFVGGVGLREEFCKLLLFIPFVPYLVRLGDERSMLTIASFVGLGFAAEENINYIEMSAGLDAPARFLTANFLHIALTGLAGLFLCRAIRNRQFSDFIYVFGIVIVVHGGYDALLSLPQFQEASFFAMMVYILLSMYYFRECTHLRVSRSQLISVTALFAFGLSFLLAILIVYQSSIFGLKTGLTMIVPEVLGTAIILIMFIREFNDPLGE